MAGLHVVAPSQSESFAQTRVQTAPVVPPKLVHDAAQRPWAMSPFVVFAAHPQSECTAHGREQTPAFAQYPAESDAH